VDHLKGFGTVKFDEDTNTILTEKKSKKPQSNYAVVRLHSCNCRMCKLTKTLAL
jgi:dTDP-glucose pyrophosphorylase